MKEKHIISLGEIVWDIFPDESKLGGAPLNFAYYAHQSGAHSYIISALGKDTLADKTISIVKNTGVDYSFTQYNNYPTGQVVVTLSGDGIPQYDIKENASWDHMECMPGVLELASKVDAICWGSLAQRSETTRETIFKILDAAGKDCLKVFDINIRQHYYSKEIIAGSLKRADVLKLNEDELPLVAKLFGLDKEDAIAKLTEMFALKIILFTQGALCSEVYVDGKMVSHIDTPKVKVADTVGAGDSFTSAFIANILNGKSVQEAHGTAVRTSAYVCTCSGAINPLPKDL